MSYAVADIESNGLLYDVSKIWCLIFVDDEDRTFSYTGVDILKGLEALDKYDTVVFHNAYGYDLPLLKKLLGFTFTAKVEDTFVMSSLFRPDIGKHGIEAWGERLGIQKPEHEDWSRFSVEMLHRCEEDVRIGKKVYELFLHNELEDRSWTSSLRLEYAMASIASQQEVDGVAVDMELMLDLVKKINKERDEIAKYVLERVPKNVVHTFAEMARPFTVAGLVNKNCYKWLGADCMHVVGAFNKVTFVDMNLRSTKQVKGYLLSQGWRPTQWNFKKGANGRVLLDDNRKEVRSSPKLTEDSFHTIEGELPQKLARLSVLNHRRSMLIGEEHGTGWINKVRSDGRIPAGGIPQGTPTGRYRHTTVVNVPKAREDIPFGVEFRSIFCAKEGYILLGSDAVALEARIEGHYTFPYDNGRYARELLEGDIHAANSKVFNTSRDLAKNGKYALTYGAQAGKLAETLNKSQQEAKKLFKSFWEANTALNNLKTDVIDAWNRKGFIYGLDKRKLFCRSEHGALNYLFQSAGSIVVKTATCYMDRRLHAAGFDFRQVLHMHDEVAFEIKEKDYVEIKKIVEQSWIDAGTYWDLNIPIEGDVQIGNNWAEVH